MHRKAKSVGGSAALHSRARSDTDHCVNAIARSPSWVPHNPSFQRTAFGAR
jgi:hypothetical protein